MDSEEFVRRVGPVVFNLSLRLTGNAADAADLAQDSLVKGLKALADFRGSDPGPWAYRITVNAWKNWLRAKSARRMLRFFSSSEDGVESEPLDIPSPDKDPEAEALAIAERRRLERAMERLTPEERAVLVLRELDGRSYQEIADSLDIPLGTVKSRLTRARVVLAQSLSAGGLDVTP
jgi:RNA polymerase sigma-70 factor (ECF subfamily)